MRHLRRCLRDSLWMQLRTEACLPLSSLPPPFAHALVNLSLEATTAAPINSIVHLSETRLRLREARGSLFLSRLDFSRGLELIFYIVEHMPIYDCNENEHKTNIFCWIFYVTSKLCELLLFSFHVKLISLTLSFLLPASLFTLSTTFPDLAQLCLPREDCKLGEDSATVRFSCLCQSDVSVSVLFSFTVFHF